VTIMRSPWSCTYSLHFAVYLYTSCLFAYSYYVNDILHFIPPLLLLIPAYNSRLLALHGHSITNRSSPGGAFTLMQPVVNVNSFPSYLSRAYFHCSRSPLYLLVYMSLVVSLCIYNQHDLSFSIASFFSFSFTACHFSVDLGCVCGYYVYSGRDGSTGGGVKVVYICFCFCDRVYGIFACGGVSSSGCCLLFCFFPTYFDFGLVFVSSGMVSATYRSRISSSDSISSSSG
jgi:hypothetical protein